MRSRFTTRRGHSSSRTTLPLLLSFTLLAACQGRHEVAGEHEFKLIASRPLQQDVRVSREYVCQVQASRHIELRALERGYIEKVVVNEGQRVKAGQPMFQILPLTYQAEQQKANAEVAAARVELDNTRRLADGNVVSPSELALADAKYRRAQAEERLAQAHLGFTDIRAPFSGLMDRLEVREGSLVEEGELLTTLSDNARMWVYFNVPEAEYLEFASKPDSDRAQPVRLRLANREFFKEPGRIAVIEADFNHETGTIPFRADFANPDGLLRHGQTCNVVLETPVPQAVLVPQKSTFEVLDHTYVFVVDAKGVVHQQRIEVREGLEDLFIVSKGLAPGDVVLIEGLRQVHDGQQVNVEMAPADKVYGSLKLHSE
jgi:membrane fusion protein, multidrug efflux system